MQTKKRKTALIWWVVALIILSVVLLTSATIYMSDVLLTKSTAWPPLLSFLKTDRSWVFVVVLALLLYGLIGSLLVRGYVSPQADKFSEAAQTESMPPVSSLWQGARTPLLIFLLLASAIGAMGYLVYAYQRYALQLVVSSELSAIADKKVIAIRQWLTERRRQAEFIARDSLIAQAFGRWLSAPTQEDRWFLETWLANLRETFDYAAVMLLDANGQVRLGLGASNIHPYRQALAQQAMASGQVILSDLHWRQEVVGGPIDLDLIAPLGRELEREKQAIGALVLTIDPGQYLFPLIQTWPTASASAETLLVRREGDEVVYLNDLRYRQGTALQLRLPLASKELPAARAIRGESGVVDGLDYRQVPVLAAVRPIPDTPWFLIAKIDTEAVYAPLSTLMWLVAIMASLLIMAAGTGTLLWWRQQHARFVAESYRRELERQVLVRHLDYLAKYANDIILLMDSQGQLLEANDRAVAAYGYTSEELLRLNIRDLRAPESHALSAEQISQAAHLDGLVFETVHQRQDGTCFPVEVSSRRIDIQGQTFLQSIIRDISERKQAEEHLRYQLQLVQSIADQAAESIFVTDRRGCVTFLNAEAERTFGFPAGELRGQRLHDKLHHHYPDGCPFPVNECPMARVYTVGETVRNHEDVFFRRDGLPVAVECSNAPFERHGQRMGAVLMVRDITQRKQAEEVLRASEERHRTILQTAMDGFWLVDTAGRLLEVNETYCRMSGYSAQELLAMRIPDLEIVETADVVATHIQKIMAEGKDRFESRHRGKDGSLFDVEVSVQYHPVEGGRFVGFLRDITERKRAEAAREKLQRQLIQAQKMESVGRLAGGVAHDFNNLLGVILGYVDLALEQVDPAQPLFANLQEIRKATERSANLTRQLLAFARKQTVTPQVLDLNETVAGMLKMLRRLIGEDIDFAWRPGAGLWPVKMDPAQIDQLLANLCVNARDAIRGVGKITIETETAVLDEAYCATHGGFVPGEFVLLAVSDDGCGMDQETLEQIFEPFFTTKGVGQGTGLGLATLYGIVKQNDGFINVYSEPGKGTTFKIYLPRYVGKAAPLPKEGVVEPVNRGHETVLLVEDEPAILAMGKMMLESFGYRVLAAGTPGAAIRLAEEHAGEIHLLMTDVVMPEMNGRDLARRLLSLYPNLKRLFMSGYTANVIAHHGILDEGVQFIQKPFSMKALATKVREALERE